MNPGPSLEAPPFSVVWFWYALGGAVILGGYLFVFLSLISCLVLPSPVSARPLMI